MEDVDTTCRVVRTAVLAVVVIIAVVATLVGVAAYANVIRTNEQATEAAQSQADALDEATAEAAAAADVVVEPDGSYGIDTSTGVATKTDSHRCTDPQYVYTITADGTEVYVIQPGDTLSEIAERTGVSVSELTNYNSITCSDLIYAGSLLQIPSE